MGLYPGKSTGLKENEIEGGDQQDLIEHAQVPGTVPCSHIVMETL